MSVILESPQGLVVCHENYLQKLYGAVNKEEAVVKLGPHQSLFLIKTPYMRDGEVLKKVKDLSEFPNKHSLKRKYKRISVVNAVHLTIDLIKGAYCLLLTNAQQCGHFTLIPSDDDIIDNNRDARTISEKLYKESSAWNFPTFKGENDSDEAVLKKVGSDFFVFPPQSRFYCYDVRDIKSNVDSLGKFDLILLDPPWWNKYIRRKRSKCSSEGYNMMYNDHLVELPLNELLAPEGIIAVWCTNSESNLGELKNKLFPEWGTQQIAQWTWMKVTKSGQPICPFSEPPGKQPFEQLLFGVRSDDIAKRPQPQDGKIFMSVPSAIHSHKPPIAELMEPYLPSQPRCLEIFARYLLPNWTSWGLEVIKLQHFSLFQEERPSEIVLH